MEGAPGVPRPPAGVRARIEDKALRHGLAAPWWIGTTAVLAQVAAALVALAQRDALLSPALLAVAVVAAPFVVQAHVHAWVPAWVDLAAGLVGAAWIAALPVVATGLADFLPVSLAFLVAHVTAATSARVGAVAAVSAIGVAVVLPGPLLGTSADPGGAVVGVLEVCLGAVIGYWFRTQMRALAAERAARSQEAERAALAERQRIAREIHDLVAHSLSVTVLHVAGARQVLLDGVADAAEGRPAALDEATREACEALADAEEVGRRAMADIRRTVGLLARGDGEGRYALPDARDLPALVAQVRAAGLPVEAAVEGDLAAVPPALGLGLYRVLQESLANAARHAPGAPVQVEVDVRRGARLRVVNEVLPGAVPGTDGSGTDGMAARVAGLGGTLRAGRRREGGVVRWVVEAEVAR
ncbi:signal transduction histidine kinase [Nocardioides zeae]|uniref:Signal transduction histidine kinase n=1 Tax=Nocardioides zeae TaxID=1457234 RepID=A0ACC6IMN6_9ACTN|nr:histidine kinase [Nocardioides zeae]MDR6173837.1 signal transduction histidine kinase [Nocardioides zeae]MDR6211875.1 signal transduction histidine kinase [Nocardioides zeae]